MKLSQLQGQSAQPGLSVNTLSCISEIAKGLYPSLIGQQVADQFCRYSGHILNCSPSWGVISPYPL